MKATKTANLIERTPLLGGYTLYTFQSPTNPLFLYRVLTKDGIADPATHSDCISFVRNGDCPHMQVVIAHETDAAAAYDATDGTEAAHKVLSMSAALAAKVARGYADADLEAFDKQEGTHEPKTFPYDISEARNGRTYRTTSSRVDWD